MVHSLRCTPSSATHLAALQDFDRQVRGCFAALTGLHLDGVQWEQAARGLALGGLSLRSAARDSSAAYLTSAAVAQFAGPRAQRCGPEAGLPAWPLPLCVPHKTRHLR